MTTSITPVVAYAPNLEFAAPEDRIGYLGNFNA
jgi:hypothetical protein